MRPCSWLAVLPLVWLLASPLSAQQPVAAPAGIEAVEEEPAEGEEEREPGNELAVVVAGTRERAEDATSPTLGAEYERRLTRRLGVVAELEYVQGPGTWVFAAPFVFRPAGRWKLFVGPGLERRPVGGEHESSRTTSAEQAREQLFLWRMGAGYGWEFSERYVIGPSVYADFVREDARQWTRAYVFALSAGVVF